MVQDIIRNQKRLLLPLAAAIPLLLTALFHLLKGNKALMGGWVFGVVAPLEQTLGRFWGIFSFSGAEALTAAALTGTGVWLLWAVVPLWRKQFGHSLRRVFALAAAGLWLWAGLCWFWNAAYYAPTFAQQSGLKVEPYPVERLSQVTAYYAQHAARLSAEVPRDQEGHFLRDTEAWFEAADGVYDGIAEQFPLLEANTGRPKGLVCSRLQSLLGFTGVYFPFTGEANVNVDAPACLIPATIAHEMAHQRMVASEQEANFVGIAAAITSGHTTYAYSGYLFGLIQLCNALYPVAPEVWSAIATTSFTPEMAQDWRDNNEYWAALSSSVEDAAERAYDSFLKTNGQELGIRSYGACVDLLVAWTE